MVGRVIADWFSFLKPCFVRKLDKMCLRSRIHLVLKAGRELKGSPKLNASFDP